MQRLWRLTPVALMSAACVYSLHPLADGGPLEMEPGLVGTWEGGQAELVQITRQPDSTYSIRLTDADGTTGSFVGRLVRVGALRVLDVTPETMPSGRGETYDGHFLPLHSFWVVREAGDRLVFASLQPDSLRAYLDRRPGGPLYTMWEGGSWVLTAPSSMLQSLMAEVATRRGFLEEGDPLVRLARVIPGR